VDRRPQACWAPPAHAFRAEQRQEVLEVCNQPEHAALPPGQIVPRLADQGRYVASESPFYGILHAEGQQHHRGRSKKPVSAGPPTTHCAAEPNDVWCSHITWLRALFLSDPGI